MAHLDQVIVAEFVAMLFTGPRTRAVRAHPNSAHATQANAAATATPTNRMSERRATRLRYGLYPIAAHGMAWFDVDTTAGIDYSSSRPVFAVFTFDFVDSFEFTKCSSDFGRRELRSRDELINACGFSTTCPQHRGGAVGERDRQREGPTLYRSDLFDACFNCYKQILRIE